MSDSQLPPPLPPPDSPERGSQRPDSSTSSLRNVLLTVLASIAAIGFFSFKAYTEKRANEMKQARAAQEDIRKMQEEMRKEMLEDPNSGSTEERLKRAQSTLQEASKKLSGDNRQLMEVSTAFLGELTALSVKYDQSINALQEASVLAPESNDTREKITANRARIQAFLDANKELNEYIQNWEKHYETFLRKHNISEKNLQEALTGFTRAAQLKRPFLTTIRACDTRIGNAYMGTLDIFEEHFGKWKIQPGTGLLILPDDATIEKYNSLMEEIDAAGEDQASAQKKYLRL